MVNSSTAKCLYCAKEIDASIYEDHIIECQIDRQKKKTPNVKTSKSRKSKQSSRRKAARRRSIVVVDGFDYPRATRVKQKRTRKKVRVVQGGLPSLGKRK
ncbi:MAG: hypothetical protein DMF75_14355 [Acidobacteria bacterium]|nr:MAG: hypothetical protein DMF75_14355 [Acidobacteriota bacterium]